MVFKDNSLNIAEDDKFRSECIRKLVQNKILSRKYYNTRKIPKVIIQFWHNLNDLPNDVYECLNSWKPLINQGFNKIIFDNISAREFIQKHFSKEYTTAFDLCCHPAMCCDYFRLCYLLKLGGAYVDADEVFQGGNFHSFFIDNHLKIQPLCYDSSSDKMIKKCNFLKADAYIPSLIFYVNNNPIITPPAHPVIKLALERATTILLKNPEKRSDIQSTTGPGNLSASLVAHYLKHKREGQDFDFLYDWDLFSISKWPLSYRNDKRNWRIWRSLIFQGKVVV